MGKNHDELFLPYRLMETTDPKTFRFQDDGKIPNSNYPLLIYQRAFNLRGDEGAEWLEQRFASHDWMNTWRWGVYAFHHYHSNTHEVLGVFRGNALLHMGGEKGQKLEVSAGDIIVIPAGVGHKCLTHSDDFTVVGAYPGGLEPDLMKGTPDERPNADKRIAAVPLPLADPLLGRNQGLVTLWK
ncbi:MAG TPA: cupin domain-containing protein [Chryseolinea sp.]|nr:cupin domain-containing protein [Chryseolinea sp.]